MNTRGKKPKPDPIFEIVGKGSSKDTDLSYNHDHYLYGWPKQRPPRGKARAPKKRV